MTRGSWKNNPAGPSIGYRYGGPIPVPQPPQPASGWHLQNGTGVAALACGILGLVLWPVAIAAIVAGAVGRDKARRGLADNYGQASWGFWLGIIEVGVVVLLVGLLITSLSVGPFDLLVLLAALTAFAVVMLVVVNAR